MGMKVKRITVQVYCLSCDVKSVKEEADQFFFGSQSGLWRPRSPQIDNGTKQDAKHASKFLEDLDRGPWKNHSYMREKDKARKR